MLKKLIMESKPALYLEFFLRTGPVAVLQRILRKIRYFFVYPFLGKKLFKAPDIIPDYDSHHNLVLKALDLFYAKNREIVLTHADDILNGWFCFLNKRKFLGIPVKWNKIPVNDPLWQYTLHYGEWTKILCDAFLFTGKKEYLNYLIILLKTWIDENPPGSLPSWEPYPISRRVPVWSMVAILLKGNKEWDEFCRNMLFPSIWSQCLMLEKNPETDIKNNHLIANFKALAWIGLVFPKWPGAEKWREMGLKGLWQEMELQVLADGVHNERTISYHKIVLLDFFEIKILCKALGYKIPALVDRTICAMTRFLCDIKAPDGSFPMFNDSVPGYPENFDSLFEVLKKNYNIEENKNPLTIYPHAGYAVLRNNDDLTLWFDFGKIGPSYLPGHGHADTLAISVFANGKWLISDPGVYSYHDKKWRNYFRSTLAHSTVCIDGKDQAVFWGPFRVAYPPKTRLVSFSHTHVTGELYGYCRFDEPVIHRRRVEILSGNRFLITDRFMGRGRHDFVFVLRFAKDAKIILYDKLKAVVKWPKGIELYIEPVKFPENAAALIYEDWISSSWNLKEKAFSYRLNFTLDIPVKTDAVYKIGAVLKW